MPYRKVSLETGRYYHVFNRGVARLPIFDSDKSYIRFIKCLDYYRHVQIPSRLSFFLDYSTKSKDRILSSLNEINDTLVEIIAFCLMPNHYHLLLKQNVENGISIFVRKSMNAYSSYFNKLTKREGTLYQDSFRFVKVESDEQLLHLSRYIHINPILAGLVSFKNFINYPWNSLISYSNNEIYPFVNSSEVLSFFNGFNDYKNFLTDQIDYKKSSNIFSHLHFD